MDKKESRAAWFPMFRNIRNVVDAVPDESAGAALKAVFAYFDTRSCLTIWTRWAMPCF